MLIGQDLDHICWSPTERVAYAGGEAGQLYRFDLSGADAVEIVTTVPGGGLLGLALDWVGDYACDQRSDRVQRITASVASHGDPIGYPNYLVFDPDGGLCVSDSGGWDTASSTAAVCKSARDSARLSICRRIGFSPAGREPDCSQGRVARTRSACQRRCPTASASTSKAAVDPPAPNRARSTASRLRATSARRTPHLRATSSTCCSSRLCSAAR